MNEDIEVHRAFELISRRWKFENPGVDEPLFEAIRKHMTFDANMFAFEYFENENYFFPFFKKYGKIKLDYWEDWHAFEQGGIYCVETNGIYFPDEENPKGLPKGILQTHSTMYGMPLHHSFVREQTREIARNNPFFNLDIKLVIPVLQHCFPQVNKNLEEVLGVPYEINASFNPIFLDVAKVI
jgi:hypothetical protein